MARNTANNVDTSANVGYEAQIWQMTDVLRGSMDATEYKHVVLGASSSSKTSPTLSRSGTQRSGQKNQKALTWGIRTTALIAGTDNGRSRSEDAARQAASIWSKIRPASDGPIGVSVHA